MSNLSLPPLVEKYFAAADKNDWDTLAGCFADAGVMIDDGKAYAGRAEIRRRRQIRHRQCRPRRRPGQ